MTSSMNKKIDENNNSIGKSENGEIAPSDGLKKFNDDFVTFLYKSHGRFYDENIKKIEEATKLTREQIAYSLIGFKCIYMIIGSSAEFFCNLIGFMYPAYISVKAIRTEETEDDTTWLIYWSVFATFSLFDFFALNIMSVFPLYWLIKTLFLIYLYLPQTKGAQMLYKKVVNPLVDLIDQLLEPAEVKEINKN